MKKVHGRSTQWIIHPYCRVFIVLEHICLQWVAVQKKRVFWVKISCTGVPHSSTFTLRTRPPPSTFPISPHQPTHPPTDLIICVHSDSTPGTSKLTAPMMTCGSMIFPNWFPKTFVNRKSYDWNSSFFEERGIKSSCFFFDFSYSPVVLSPPRDFNFFWGGGVGL